MTSREIIGAVAVVLGAFAFVTAIVAWLWGMMVVFGG